MSSASSGPRRIGVFGGTFDPIHLGHLIVAEQCRETGRLDEVWFVPAGSNPFREDHKVTPFERRVEMIELAIAGHPAFRVDTVEEEMLQERRRQRPQERQHHTYTADTLAELHRRHPDVELYFLVGSDLLSQLSRWYQPHRVIQNAALLVMLRAGYAALSAEELQASLVLPPAVPLRIEFVPSPPLIDISSTDLRRRLAEGHSVRYLVPRAVECYIQEKRLYHCMQEGERGGTLPGNCS